MKNTPKGLRQSDFQLAEKIDNHNIDSSSHNIDPVFLKKRPQEKFLKKTYASPDLLQKTSSNNSYMGSIISFICKQLFTGESSSDAKEEQRHLELSGQLEALYSALYRIILCNQAAETYAIYDDSNTCAGTVSKIIPGFISAKKQKILVGQNIPDLAKMITASYIYEEDDLHKGNYGVDEDKKIARLDFDMSGWSKTYKVKGKRAISTGNIALRNPRDRFPITQADVESLPVLSDAKPFYWPTSFFYYFDDSQDFYNLKDDLSFNRHKYLTFLQFCLIPDSYFESLGALYLQDKYKEDRNIHVKSLIDRKNELKRLLLDMPAFQCFILNRGIFKTYDKTMHPYNTVKAAFRKYNQYIRGCMKFQEDEVLKTDRIKYEFEEMYDRAKKKIENSTIEFKCNNYEPFKVPDKELAIYRKRKEKVKEQLRKRLNYLKELAEISKSTTAIIVNPATKLDGLYNKYLRRQDIKKIKIAWLKEVLENAEDDNKVIMEWFQTKHTPFFPIIQTGETGRLIDSIRESESNYANRLIKLHQQAVGEIHLDEDPDVILNDDFLEYTLEGDIRLQTEQYIIKLKSVFAKEVMNLVTEYSKSASFYDVYAYRRKSKHDFWIRVQGELKNSKTLFSIFEAFRFKTSEQANSSDILAGTTTQKFITYVANMKCTFPDDLLTERNHAIKWLNRFIKDTFNEKGHSASASYMGLWGTGTNSEYKTLIQALGKLKDPNCPIKSALNHIKKSGLAANHPELERLLEHFQATSAIEMKDTSRMEMSL